MSTSSVAASSSPAVPSSSNSPAPVTATTTNATADLPAKTPPNPNSTTNANNTTTASSTSASASIYGHAKRLSTSSSSSSSPFPPRPSPPALDTPQKLARNVSPGLLARMKFLNQINDNANKSQTDVGRIEEDKIRRLDQFHKDRNFSVERRGTAWGGTGPGRHSQTSTPLIPQHTGESVPALSMEPDFSFSDRSSVVSTSDKVLPSESEPENDDVLDMQKYRLPDTTKPNKILTQPIAQVLEPDGGINRPTMTLVPDATSPDADGGINRPTITRPITEQPARAPTPPPKDTPKPTPPAVEPEEEVSVLDDHNVIDIESYFKKRHFARAGSIYTLSKASFTNQIQGLTSMKLPPTTIASEITALPSSTLAGRALHRAANDIRLWMAKAIEVLGGLDAEDDVEWAAAAGREGLAEVDAAITKFEGLVTVYITAIEDLQARPDIASLPSRDQATLVSQMEDIVSNWSKIKQTLKGIKNQVEIAMEWEELWNNVLGEIGAEVEDLSRLVFEMEERRHRVISDSVAEASEKFDIAELETIVEETPRNQPSLQSKRLSMPPAPSAMSPISPIPQIEQENSRLLALFAKLQPLRASLDFLPMRLASFQARASKIFPSACDELSRRKDQLEEQEKRLEAEAEALRLELGEDKWVHTFRQAGSKAVAMYNSCMKSIQRLQQAIDDNDEEKIASRIASYNDKKDNYLPSIKRVLQLIDIEMKRRSTVNGEILRIQQDVRTKLEDLESVTKDMDAILDDLTTSRKLRDSVSTVLSARTDASMSTSALDTPASSPASSVVISRKASDHKVMTPTARKSRQSSLAGSKTTRPTLSKPALPKSNPPPNRRYSSLPMSTGPSFTIRRPLGARDDSPLRTMSATGSHLLREPATERPAVKPRWNSSVNMRDTVVGHNFKPLSLTTPSQYSKPTTPQRNLRSVSSQSNIPIRSPLSRSSALSPSPSGRPASTTPAQQVTRKPLGSPMQSPSTPARGKLPMRPTPTSTRSIGTPSSSRRILAVDEDVETGAQDDSPIARRTRPASAMTSRRTSVLPTPKQRTNSTTSQGSSVATPGRSSSRLDDLVAGRTSRAAEGRSSRAGGRQSSMGDRPVWR